MRRQVPENSFHKEGKNHPLVLFQLAGSAHKLESNESGQKKNMRTVSTAGAALDATLLTVVSYALILLSQSRALF
jgi:hypothetical protein